MSERQKRRRLSDDGTAAVVADAALGEDSQSKSHKKETNASAKRSLFVRSLPTTVTSEALTELFSENYPLKHATVVLDPVTKQSKGYGFVTFADADDAQRAKDEFNGHSLQGRKIRVEVAEPRSRDAKSSTGKSLPSQAALAAKQAREAKLKEDRKPPKLIIRNLPWSIKDAEQLSNLFRRFGKVKQAIIPQAKAGQQAGFAFVVIRGQKNAEKALAEMNGFEIDGRQIAVDWAVDKEVWEKQKDVEPKADGEKAEKADKKKRKAEDNEPKGKKEDGTFNTDDDVANFFKNHIDDLESEPEDEDEDDKGKDEDDEDKEDNEDNSDADEDDEELSELDEDWEDASLNGLKEDGNDEEEDTKPKKVLITDNSTTLFIRNLAFTIRDEQLKEHFEQFGPVRYARVVMDRATDRPKGTGFVCFYNVDDAVACFKGAPKHQPTGANAVKHSVLEDSSADPTGKYTLDGRLLQVSRAVAKDEATKLTEEGTAARFGRDVDKRKLYLLGEGSVAVGTPLYELLSPAEIKLRNDSSMQRKKLIQSNPSLHLSLTRLAIRNIPRSMTSKDLKALARQACVGFATEVKEGKRKPLSKEEEARGGEAMKEAERLRKQRGKGIVRQAKIVFEGREGKKVSEESGAGRSRGYGFVEYSSHRWALMGLRYMNGRLAQEGQKQRLIVEFAIENAAVVQRRREKEEKARTRSGEVEAAIAKGEKVERKPREKGREGKMAHMRKKGLGREKTDRRGKAQGKEEKSVNGWDDGKGKGVKRKRGGDDEGGKEKKSPRKAAGSAAPTAEDDKLAKKQQIIGKKRAQRRRRKGGA
jgi:nucleolar protein 4